MMASYKVTNAPSQSLLPPKFHRVSQGDSLSSISALYGRSAESICKLNHLSPDAPLCPGADLVVPDWFVSAQQMSQMGWSPAGFMVDLNNCLRSFSITTAARVRHFLSQCSHESACGKFRKEIASGVDYEGRAELGNTEDGDGPRFKGAGFIQITGRYNYQQLANFLQDPQVMEGVEYVAAVYPWTSAGFWWWRNRMNDLCDAGADVEAVTRRVNGGVRGLQNRMEHYATACAVFPDQLEPTATKDLEKV
jgi:predicted chitinase